MSPQAEAARLEYWAGLEPPSTGYFPSNRLLMADEGRRETPELHGAFETVNLNGIDLGNYRQWPLLLDEALRLLKIEEPTELHLRLTECEHISIFQVANFLRRRSFMTFDLLNQVQTDLGSQLMHLRCFREHNWTDVRNVSFGVITNGERLDHLSGFLQSILEMDDVTREQCPVFICGPQPTRATQQLIQGFGESLAITYIKQPTDFSDYGWITEKKNLIVESATTENILIVHDRYRIPRSFLRRLAAYGADFDVIVPRQVGADGRRDPDWVALSDAWSWSIPVSMPYDELAPNGYVPGGAMLAKRAVLQQIPWNSLLMWNQAEDVELTRELVAQGITPRIAPQIFLRSEATHNSQRGDFLEQGSKMDSATAEIAAELIPSVKRSHSSEWKTGLHLSEGQWQISPDGAVLNSDEGSLTINLPPDFQQVTHANPLKCRVIVLQGGERKRELTVSIGGRQAQIAGEYPYSESNKRIYERDCEPSLNTRAIKIDVEGRSAIVTSVMLYHEGPFSYPIFFRSGVAGLVGRQLLLRGWSRPESWGCWSDGPVALVEVPVPLRLRGSDLTVTLAANVYGHGSEGEQCIAVLVNSRVCRMLVCKASDGVAEHKVQVSSDAAGAPAFLLELRILAPASPVDRGSTDRRELGFGLHSLTVEAA